MAKKVRPALHMRFSCMTCADWQCALQKQAITKQPLERIVCDKWRKALFRYITGDEKEE